MASFSKKRCALSQRICLLFSAVFAVLGYLASTRLTDLLWREIYKNKHLGLAEGAKANSSAAYNELLSQYINPPFSMRLQIWVFNVTNPAELMNVEESKEKPKLKELGPYTFKEVQRKEVTLNDNGTLFYRTFRTYFFDEKESCANCSLDDEVVVASIAFQGIVDKVSELMILKRKFIEHIVKTKDPTLSVFRRQLVRELLFEGYADEEIEKVCALPSANCPPMPAKIGLFYEKNGTNDDGILEVDTGQEDVTSLGRVRSWNYMPSMADSFWYGARARIINGTDSQLYPARKLLERQNLVMFIAQAYRTVEFEFKEVSDFHGLPVQRYVPAKSLADRKLEDEKGFCDPENEYHYGKYEGNCAPPGLTQVHGYDKAAVRVFLSNAHFFGAAPELRESVECCARPNAADDLTFIDIEPYTGVLVQAQRRSQLSLGLSKGSLDLTAHMADDLILPIIWLNNSMIVDGAVREQLSKLLYFFWLASILPSILYAAGALCFAVAALLLMRTFTASEEGGHSSAVSLVTQPTTKTDRPATVATTGGAADSPPLVL